MRKVSAPEVVTAIEATESPLPPKEALGELVGAAREGLLALSVGVGLGVVHELMELEVDDSSTNSRTVAATPPNSSSVGDPASARASPATSLYP